MLNRSRSIVWLVTGPEKAEMLARLYAADRSIPAGRIRQDQALVLADHDAARALQLNSVTAPGSSGR
jgi:6-phosphogluconolactonase